jgi:O-antigen/teichoic acid export membrane protein
MSSRSNSREPAAEGGAGRESLAVGYLWSLGATALPLVSAFVASLIIARWMGPEVIGLVSLTQALATALLIVAKFGIEGAASRLVSEYQVSSRWRIPRLIRSATLLRLAFTVPTAAAATIFAPQLARFFGKEALLPLFRLSGLLIFAVSINEFAALVVLGLKRFKLLFSMRAVMLVMKISLVFFAAVLAMGTESILGAYIAAALVPGVVVLAALLAMRTGRGSLPDDEPITRRLLALSTSLAVSGASVTVYSLLDRLMLGYFSPAAQVGLYTMSRNIVETVLFPTFALIMVLRPALAAAYTERDRERCSNLVYRSIQGSFFYAMCVIVVVGCLARPLITGLYTERFLHSADLLVLFLPLVMMRSLGAVILPSLIAAERAGTYAGLTLTGAVLNFALNALLIPRFGASGAVLATLASYLPIEILGLREVHRAFGGLWRRGDWARSLKTVSVGALIIALYELAAPAPAGLAETLLHACLIAALFAAAILSTKTLSLAEFSDYAASVWKRGRRR